MLRSSLTGSSKNLTPATVVRTMRLVVTVMVELSEIWLSPNLASYPSCRKSHPGNAQTLHRLQLITSERTSLYHCGTDKLAARTSSRRSNDRCWSQAWIPLTGSLQSFKPKLRKPLQSAVLIDKSISGLSFSSTALYTFQDELAIETRPCHSKDGCRSLKYYGSALETVGTAIADFFAPGQTRKGPRGQ